MKWERIRRELSDGRRIAMSSMSLAVDLGEHSALVIIMRLKWAWTLVLFLGYTSVLLPGGSSIFHSDFDSSWALPV